MPEDKASVYLETSVVSYLAARPSRDLVTQAHQQLTVEWWERERTWFDLFVSELVLSEAERGDSEAAGRRLEWLTGLAVLEDRSEIRDLAAVYLRTIPLPEKAVADALHLAFACWYEMGFLLTWNCRHLANALVRRRLDEINRVEGIPSPTICTPEELTHGIESLD